MAIATKCHAILSTESIYALPDQAALLDMRQVEEATKEGIQRLKELVACEAVQVISGDVSRLERILTLNEFKPRFLALDEPDLYELVET